MLNLIHIIAGTIIDTSGLPQPNTNDTIQNALDIVFTISASLAVLMTVIGGFRYIIARGDPSATASARNTILYALVGLVVVIAAYSIVTFAVKGIG